jgi:hypothetical protein
MNQDERFQFHSRLGIFVQGVYQNAFYAFKWLDLAFLLIASCIMNTWVAIQGYQVAPTTLLGIATGVGAILLFYFRPLKPENRFLLPMRIAVAVTTLYILGVSAIPGAWEHPTVSAMLLACVGASFLCLVLSYSSSLVLGAKHEQTQIVKRRAQITDLLHFLNGKADIVKTTYDGYKTQYDLMVTFRKGKLEAALIVVINDYNFTTVLRNIFKRAFDYIISKMLAPDLEVVDWLIDRTDDKAVSRSIVQEFFFQNIQKGITKRYS